MDAGIIALIIAGITLAGAIVKFAATLKETQTEHTTALTEIHVLVNERMTETLDRIDQLTLALEDADIQVPRAPGRDEDG